MKSYKKVVFIIFLSTLYSLHVTIPDAENVVNNFLHNKRNIYSTEDIIIHSLEVIRQDSNDLIYLFHLSPIGFIMISADYRVAPILAYSLNNSFNWENIVPPEKLLIQSYKASINNLITLDKEDDNSIHQKWNKYLTRGVLSRVVSSYVLPLITSEFGQDGNWNNNCPVGCEGNQEALVGCVAVAMAQIMHYWKYPISGEGRPYYIHEQFGELDINLSEYNYDYSAMGDGTEETEAAALLLFHAGVAVNMNYGCEESGAFISNSQISNSISAEYALENHFKYASSLYTIERSQISDDEFVEIIKDELDQSRPFIWAGYENGDDGTLENGHAWVCDGYDEDDLFHMNWGWGSDHNNYFSINQLTPQNYNFNANNLVLLGIHPPEESIVSPQLKLESYVINEIVGDNDQVLNPGETIELSLEISNSPMHYDATSYEIELISIENSKITLLNDFYSSFELLKSGDNIVTSNNPFIISVDSDIELGNIKFILSINAFGKVNEQFNNYFNQYEIDIGVTLDQAGFPILSTSSIIGEIVASPLVIDINNDNKNEIVIGDKNGFIFVFNTDGSIYGDGLFPFNTSANPESISNGGSGQIWGSAAAADLNNDGYVEFVIPSKSKHLYLFDYQGYTTYNADNYLIGTPSIGNIDNQEGLDIVFTAYSSTSTLFVINSSGEDLNGFPLGLGAKTKAGPALADFNDNGKEDIVIGLDNNMLFLVYDDGTIANGFPFEPSDSIYNLEDYPNGIPSNRSMDLSPSIIEINGEKVIIIGSTDNNLYAINEDGSLRFYVHMEKDIVASPSFVKYNQSDYIFFGSKDSLIHAVNINGESLNGWPINAGSPITESVVFSDIDCDGEIEAIVANSDHILAFSMDGKTKETFPIKGETSFTGPTMIIDLDQDGDLEIICGQNGNLSGIDIKSTFNLTNSWNMFRGNMARTGYYNSNLSSENLGCSVLSTELDYSIPKGFTLHKIYPNPFNPISNISFSIQKYQYVSIDIYDIRGRLIKKLFSGFKFPGEYKINWDASQFTSGLYLIQLKTNRHKESQKVLLIK